MSAPTLKTLINRALAGLPQTIPRSFFTWSSPLVFSCEETAQQTMRLCSDPSWHNMSYSGKDKALSFQNLKDSRIEDFKTTLSDPTADGFEFLSTNSSGRTLLSCTRVQGAKNGYLWLGPCSPLWPGGSDHSCWTVLASEAHGCQTGFKVVGFNSLDFHFLNCRATACHVGLDLTEGGACSVLDHFGGSSCKTLVKVNGGYECDIRALTSELCDTVLQIGEPGDAGEEMNHDVSFGNNRDCKLVADIYGAGEKLLTFAKPVPQKVRVTNKSDRLAKLTVVGNPYLTVEQVGKWEVRGAQAVVNSD